MCIAIVKTRSGTITDDILKNCFKNNPDGAGVAWSKDNNLYYIKGLFDVNSFIQAVRQAESEADNNILIHCRIGTSGLRDKSNTHPHIVNENTVMIHNGILNIDVPKDSKKSDTVLFIEQYLKDLPLDFMNNKAILKMIAELIGDSNKFCFLNSQGDYAIVNESKGHWINGVWYSNMSFEDYTTYRYMGYNYFYNDLDEDYYSIYGVSRDEFLDKYDFDNTTKKVLIDRINSLSDMDLDMLGASPIFDVQTYRLRPESLDNDLKVNEFYLYELDDEVQDLYDYRYYCYDYKEDNNETYV